MIYLKKPGLQIAVDQDIETEDLVAQLVLVILRLRGSIDLPKLRL